MDIGAIVGLVLVFGLVLMAMVTGAGIGVYIDVPSFLIVIGGSIGIVIAAYPFSAITASFKAVMKFFFHSEQPVSELIAQLVDFATRARRDGILALESAESEMQSDFLKKGIRLAVDGTDPEIIRTILETELEFMGERHKSGLAVLSILTDMAPAMGMIGTLVGLVAMLQSMDDPSAIGPSMAVALLTTMYGAVIANMITIPMATRLGVRSGDEQLARQIMLAGIMSIQAGDNPRVVEQKLNAFLPPSQRQTQFE